MIHSSDSPDDHHQSPLLWSNPLLGSSERSNLILIISPYSNAAAVSKLFEGSKFPPGLQIVTTWSSSGLLSGACDPELYPFLKEAGGRLYLHSNIHLKLYILSSSEAILSTGNLTQAGLGLSQNSNIELSTMVALDRNDWQQVDQIMQHSQPVTDQIYEVAKAYIDENQATPPPQLELPPPGDDDFSYLSLPATRSPEDLWSAYFSGGTEAGSSITAEVAHDLNLYALSQGLTRDVFFARLGPSFRDHPFIHLMVAWLQAEESASFGKLKAWVRVR